MRLMNADRRRNARARLLKAMINQCEQPRAAKGLVLRQRHAEAVNDGGERARYFVGDIGRGHAHLLASRQKPECRRHQVNEQAMLLAMKLAFGRVVRNAVELFQRAGDDTLGRGRDLRLHDIGLHARSFRDGANQCA